MEKSSRSPASSVVRLIFIIALLVFFGEFTDNIIFDPVYSNSVWWMLVVKTIIIAMCIIPVLYWTVYRPFQHMFIERNISAEQLRVEQGRIAEEEQRYRKVFETLSEGVALNEMVFNNKGEMVDYTILEVNAAFYSVADYRQVESVVGNRASKVYGMNENVISQFWNSHKDRTETVITEFTSPLSGKIFEVSTSPFFQGKFVTTFHDITERKKNENALRMNEAKLRSVLDTSRDAIGVHVGGIWVMCNPAAVALFGVSSAGDLIGTSLLNVIAPSERGRITEYVKSRTKDSDASVVYITKGLRSDGVEFDMEVTLSTFLFDEKVHVFVILRDITDRLKLESDLRTSEERFRSLFVDHSAVMLLIDPESGAIMDANTSAVRFYGFPAEVLRSMNISSINALSKHEVAEQYGKAARSEQNRFIFPHRHSDGSIRDVEVYSTLLTVSGKRLLFSIIHDISERRSAEEQLEQSEKTFRHFVEESGDGISIVGEDGRVIEWNRTLEQITGIPSTEAIGCSFIEIQKLLAPDLVTAEFLLQQEKIIQHALQTGEAPFFNTLVESPFRTRLGELRTVQQMVFPIKTQNGFRLGMISRDHTERANSEDLVKRTRQNYETFFNTIDDLLLVLDEQGSIIFTNKTVTDRLGYTAEELRGRSVLDLHPEERRNEAAASIAEMLKGTADFCSVPLKKRNGDLIPVETKVKYGTWNNSPVIFGVTKDISRIQASEEKFSKLFYLNPSACGLSDLSNGHYAEVNDAFCSLFGYEASEVIGKSAMELGIVNEETIRMLTSKMGPNGRLMNAEAQLRTKHGDVKHVLLSAENIIVQEKRFRFTMVHDITEEKRAQNDVASLALRNETILHTASDGIHVLDESGNVVEANHAFAEMLGYTRDEVMKLNVAQWDAQWSAAELITKVNELISRPAVFETQYRRKDGMLIDVEINSTGVMLQDRRFLYASARDITERKTSEEALRHTQKLESIGTLAGGIAHDFNNLLVAILGQSSVALNKLPKDSPAWNNITKVIKASERAADLTRQLLAYSGKGKFFIQEIDLNTIIRENAQMFELSVPKSCDIEFLLDPASPRIKGDVGQIQQVIMNLIINAGEAIGKESGRITIESSVKDLSAEQSEYWRYTNAPLASGTYSALRVTDTGCGISRESLSKIFDPFYSTKFTGRGLGLAAVLGIIRGHNGGLMIVSEEGKGTTFEIVLPSIFHGSSPASGNVNYGTTVDGTGKTILVIDDEPPVIELAETVLGDLQYTVMSALDPVEGIELYRRHWPNISMVVLDFSMPVMNGKQTFEALLSINTNVKVLLCSGYSEEQTFSEFHERKPAGFLQKPYKPMVFMEHLHRIMDL